MSELIGQTADGFDRYSSCSFFCAGHADLSTAHIHTTDLDHFGKNGPVIVTQTDGEAPKVALVDLPSPQANFTPAEARVVAFQLLMAADVADRAAQPTVASEVTRMLAEALAGARQ